MWIHRTANSACIFDCTPEIFDDSVSTLVSLGAMVQVRLTKQAFENSPALCVESILLSCCLLLFNAASPTYILAI